MAGPKEIPESFAHDRLAREAYLAGYSAAAEVAMSVPPPPPPPNDLLRRLVACEDRVRLLENNDADRVSLIGSCDKRAAAALDGMNELRTKVEALEDVAHDSPCAACKPPSGG
jgi:uncharacterized membrane protein YdfJ with MMPL/SSD domain